MARIWDMGKWCPDTAIVRVCCPCEICRTMWEALKKRKEE